MRKEIRLTIMLVAMACLFAIFATSAYAYSGYWLPCDSCHGVASGITVTATLTSNDNSVADYDVSAPGATQWAVFAGITEVASGTGSTGSFSVPAGATYSVYAVSGSPSDGSYGKTLISPSDGWVEPSVDDTTAPVSSSDAVASYTGRAVITITATDSGWGVSTIYFSVDGGSIRSTPIGVNGQAVAIVAPTAGGTTDHEIEFWATDRAGNDEDPQTASFSITRAAEPTGGSVTPSVMGVNGASAWTYQDLSDSFEKYEGGYVAYGGVSGWYANPHGGYDTATNKCKVCHAVHRAEGAYYLLRADSQDDACNYCHIGSAHSSKIVYDLNSAGTATNNGHTIGASTYIPDSTIAQWTEAVTLETVDANGDPLSEDIEVRAYDEQKNDMYRFARHHGHSSANGGSRRNYVPVGPLALRCMSCHQVHNASAQTWQSVAWSNITPTSGTAGGTYTGTTTSSYKLLKQFPSGTFVGTTDTYGQIPIGNISIVPETTLTAGVNYDNARAQGDDPTALSLVRSYGTYSFNMPMWVAQNFNGEVDPATAGIENEVASAVNNASLSVWCADCHNLNIGGWEELTNSELGFKAHTERTHPAPYTGAHSGPGQCYSCHRNDLSPIKSGNSCSQCHYGTGDYVAQRTTGSGDYVASDFPHSGEDGDYKMLGSYSIVGGSDAGNTTIDGNVTITSDNLDAVCIRCHGGIGTYH